MKVKQRKKDFAGLNSKIKTEFEAQPDGLDFEELLEVWTEKAYVGGLLKLWGKQLDRKMILGVG